MIVCFASLMHILWGVLLLINQSGLHVTATSTLYQMMGAQTYETRAIFYIVAGILPIVLAIAPRWTLTGLLTCFPQLALLVLSGISAVNCVALGQYPDGTVPTSPHLFILMDQGIYIILPVLYAFETLDRFHDQTVAAHHTSPVVRVGDEG